MARTSPGVHSVHEEMDRLEIQSGLFQVLQLELRFLKMFIGCLTKCEEAGKDISLTNAIAGLEAVLFILDSSNEVEDSDSHCWLNKFEKLEPEMTNLCVVLLVSLKSMSCSSAEILELVDCLDMNFRDLTNSKADILISVKNQFMVIGRKLSVLRTLVDFFAERCIDSQTLDKFLKYVKDLVDKATFLSFSCLFTRKDETIAQGRENVFSELLYMFMSCTPEITLMFTGLLKGSNSSMSEKFQVGEKIVKLVDSLLESSVVSLKDYSALLKEGLILLISFFMDQQKEVVSLIDAAISEVLSLIFSVCMNESEVNISILQESMDTVREKIRRVYVSGLNSSDFNFPTTNGLGFLRFFLENLKEMLKCNPRKIAFAKHQVMIVQQELLFLKPFLKINIELQNERDDLKDLCRRIINLVFLAEHAINSCLIIDHPIWYDMLRLSDLIKEIKLVKIEVLKYYDQMHSVKNSNSATNSSRGCTRQDIPSNFEEVVVGREEESEAIIEKLIRGIKQLDIVSIVGTGGLGKTTLAKKVYNDQSVKCYFHIRAWCYVSQIYSIRELHFDILSDVIGVDARQTYCKSTDYDLAEKLWKSLKKRKYLIVLDDIWDIEAWYSIKDSFPDDSVGSRIIFTSRIHSLVSQAKPNCCPYPLRSLSDEKSWELLKEKLYHNNSSPLDDQLTKIGKNIAKNCKGLPLAVVLVVGILLGKDKEFWKQIESRTRSQVVSEECMDVFELSYKYLPDKLKPCFLYFGAFRVDKDIRARKLMALWIAEGLIPRADEKSSYEVAENFLSDLISRDLVILKKRSSLGGIKTCRVHDLLQDLCLLKVQEENFLRCINGSNVSHSSMNPKMCKDYRLCIHAKWTEFVDTKPTCPFIHSLVLFGKQSLEEDFPFPSTVFNTFRLLNVLDMELIKIRGLFPKEVTLMVHLRYLAIWCEIAELPGSISNLWNLETLVLPYSKVILPEIFWQMKSLRHVNIHWLYLNDLEVHEFGLLQYMEIWSTPNLDSGIGISELLKRLPGLRKFKFELIEIDSYQFPELGSLTHLESLTVFACGKVILGEKRYQFPAFDLPNSLRKLTLDGLKAEWSLISIIGQLPNLEVLKLKANAFSGSTWNVEDGEFLKLMYVELNVMNIEELSVQDEPFPRLEQLLLISCKRLQEVPSNLGYIPTLKKIKVRFCPFASRSVREILEEQRHMGNDLLEVDDT